MNKKIGLIDLDAPLPNLALMKISAWHKRQNDSVSLAYPFNAKGFHTIYTSSLFKFTEKPFLPQKSVCGGTGYAIQKKLPIEIETMQPDYSLYPRCDFSWQRFSLGCIRSCGWCVVQEKEGWIRPQEPMNLNPKGRYIHLLDNNLFANPNWKEAINYLLAAKQPVWFEGVDVRIITEEQAVLLNQVKLKKQIHVAWDAPSESIYEKIKKLCIIIPPRKLMCYVLVGYNTTPEQDMYRVIKLKELGVDPFVMPFNKEDIYQNTFARWVNMKAIFKTVPFSSYKTGRKYVTKSFIQDRYL